MRRCALWALPIAVALCLGAGGCTPKEEEAAPEVYRIAVLLPQNMAQIPPALEWAQENLNQVASGHLKLVALAYQTQEELDNHVDAILTDPAWIATIAAMRSASLAHIADRFLLAQKPIISFNSTASSLFRAYGGKSFLWRTQESDLAQTELLLHHARQRGAQRVMLLADEGLDSSGFYDWFGFFATEAAAFEHFAQHLVTPGDTCIAQTLGLLESEPEIVFVAADTPQMVECMVQVFDQSRVNGRPAFRMMMVDTGLAFIHLKRMGPKGVGIEGFSSTPDPHNGFEQAFLERTDLTSLPADAANAYDAALLLGYALELSGGEGGTRLMDAIQELTSYDGPEVDWSQQGVSEGIRALQRGEQPKLRGASGALTFDPLLKMDLDASWFAHWVRKPSDLEIKRHYFTGEIDAFNAQPDRPPSLDLAVTDELPDPGPVGSSWVVIASLSEGWSNYRHQADALALYQYAKSRGVSDDRIILIGDATLVDAPENPEPDIIRQVEDGANLAGDVLWDYPILPSAEGLLNIIRGVPSDETPIVIEPDPRNSILIYLVGHGSVEGVSIGAQTASEASQREAGMSQQLLTPDALRETLCELQQSDHYRHVVLSIESCASGAMGDLNFGGLEQGCDDGPLHHVLLLSSASPQENSLSTNYDVSTGLWRSSEYSWRFLNELASRPTQSIYDLYSDIYLGVSGSHVSLYNHQHYGLIEQMTLEVFLE